jgi:hypothetical protein
MTADQKKLAMTICAILVAVGAYVLTSKLVFDGAGAPKELLPYAAVLVSAAVAAWAGISFWKKNGG